MAFFHTAPQDPRSALFDRMGYDFGKGMGESLSDHLISSQINQKLDGLMKDPKMRDAAPEERLYEIQKALLPYGERGQRVFDNRLMTEQIAEKRKLQKHQEHEAALERKQKLESAKIFGKQLGLDDEFLQSLPEGTSTKDVMDFYKAKGSKQDLSPVDKKLQEKFAGLVVDAIEQMPKFDAREDDFRELESLIEKTAFGSGDYFLGGYNPLSKFGIESESSAKMNALGHEVLQPVIEIFNKAGVLSQTKLESLKDIYAVRSWDSQEKQRAKIQVLRRMNEQARAVNQHILDIYQQTEGNISPQEVSRMLSQSPLVRQINKEADEFIKMFDNESSNEKSSPNSPLEEAKKELERRKGR